MWNYHIILSILCLVLQYQYVMIYSQSIVESHHSNLHYPKVIICAMMLDEHLYIDEWVQYNKFLGFDFIQIYDNTINGSDYLKHLSNRYHDFVRVEHYSGGGAQMEVYKKCLYKYKTKNIWAAFIDNDEFIVLHKHDNIKHLIYDIKGNNGGALYLNWIIFGTNNQLYYENQLVLKRFTERVANVSNWGKSISYLPDVNNIRPHWPLEIKDGKKLLDCHNVGNSKSEDIAAVYHFYTRSYEGYYINIIYIIDIISFLLIS